jgi:hypothetical protein
MTFLPVVERELRVAARRKSTFTLRNTGALLAIVISAFLFLNASVHNAGTLVFQTLSWFTLILSLLAGVFLASDCLSEERREGTLGLLFLTGLKGYDVVLGKFAAVALNAFYSLLTVVPALSLCLLAGGVTGAEVGRMSLVLVNTLFFAVAVALWISAGSQSAWGALSASAALLLGFLALGAATTSLSSVEPRFATTLSWLGAVSPGAAFLRAPEAGFSHQAGQFWKSLAVSHLAGWIFLGGASRRVRFFTEAARKSGIWQRIFPQNIAAGKSRRQAKLLNINPVLWLLDDSRRVRGIVWTVALLGAALLVLSSYVWGAGAWAFGMAFVWPFYFLLKLLFAGQACRFFSESRRTGAMELFCCTPLTTRFLVQGQWLALRRMFLWPIVILLATHLICVAIVSFPFASLHYGIPVFTSSLTPLLALQQITTSVADFFALGWFGMWNALAARNWSMAAGRTVLFVLILPLILFCIPTLATDALFITLGWANLRQDFRLRQMDGKINAAWTSGPRRSP